MSYKHFILRFILTLGITFLPSLVPDSFMWEGVRVDNELSLLGSFIAGVWLFFIIWCVDEEVKRLLIRFDIV